MSWFKSLLPKLRSVSKKGVPEGLWTKCPACSAVLYCAELERNLQVCSKCSHHLRINIRTRLEKFLDKNGQKELAKKVGANDLLKFRDNKKYKDRLLAAKKQSNEDEALLVKQGFLYGMPVVTAGFNFSFIGGTMSVAVGERFAIAAQASLDNNAPLICFATSGGARMQEGLFSLMQMVKTSAAIARLAKANIPYFVVLTDPTMGGVSASLATLGDIIIAEPKALIGFSGPRVIEQTIRQTLPEGFQRSEFLLDHGAIDMIIDRRVLRERIGSLLAKMLHQDQPDLGETA